MFCDLRWTSSEKCLCKTESQAEEIMTRRENKKREKKVEKQEVKSGRKSSGEGEQEGQSFVSQMNLVWHAY